MSDFEHETEAPDTAYGAQRRADWLAGMQRNADTMNAMLSGSGQAGHADTSRQLRAAHTGLFGHATPEEYGQDVSERQVAIGTEWGDGRQLQRNGGLHDSIGPAPARRDLRFVNQVQPPSESSVSPLMAYMRGQQ